MSKSNKTRYAILGMLAIEPMTGYEIGQTMAQSTNYFWAESDGQLYPALAALTKEKLITLQISKKDGSRTKKIYSLTSQGMSELKKWLSSEPETHLVRNEFMLKLFFGANISKDITIEQVQAERYRAKLNLAKLAEIEKSLQQQYKKSPHLPFWLMTVYYGLELNKAKLKWCDSTLKTLEKLSKNKR